MDVSKAAFNKRYRSNKQDVKESIEYFMEDPEIIFNKVCFLWNSLTPNFSQIQARNKDEEDNKLKDLEAHNFELGLIKLAERDQKTSQLRKKSERKDKK